MERNRRHPAAIPGGKRGTIMSTPPAFFRAAFLRFINFFRKQKLERELSADLESHLQLHIEDNLRAGMLQVQERHCSLVKLAGAERTSEAVRAATLFGRVH